MSKKILLLRYSDFHGVDTIQAHTEVIDRHGKCWWAKIGKQPSEKYLREFLDQEDKIVLLYTAGYLYRCKLGSVKRARPDKCYPSYYERDIFDKESEPEVYFELLSIEEEDLNYLEEYVICSSGKEALHDLKKSISSYMFIQHNSLPLPPKPAKRPSKERPKKKILDINSCIYKRDGKCNNRRCINYQYECDRPRYCIKQKPVEE